MKNATNATLVLASLFCFFTTRAQEKTAHAAKNRLIVEFRTGAEKFINDSIVLYYSPANGKPGRSSTRIAKKPTASIVRWELYIPGPSSVYLMGFTNSETLFFYAEPGDSVSASRYGKELVLSGRGAERKAILDSIETLKKSIPQPPGSQHKAHSLDDYFVWDAYKNNQLELCVSYIDANKGRLSAFFYNYIRFRTIGRLEEDRSDKFHSLQAVAEKSGIVSRQTLCDVFDSCFFRPYAVWMWSMPFYHSSYRHFTLLETLRAFKFDHAADSVDNEEKQLYFRYNLAQKKYKGEVLENLKAALLVRFGLKEVGVDNPGFRKLLAGYYAEPGFPEYKKYVKDEEQSLRELKLGKGKPSPDFSLTDMNGKTVTRDMIKNKVVLMDFWFTGCVGCVQLTPALKTVEEEFRNNPNVVFLSVNVDKEREKWMKSVGQKKYTTGGGLNVYTGGAGRDHAITRRFNLTGYPTLFLLGPHGFIAENQVPSPRSDNGEQLIKLIRHELASLTDGPYVMHENDVFKVYSVDEGNNRSESFDNLNREKLTIQINRIRENYTIRLQKELKNEPTVFAKPSKLFVLSDIEGNLKPFTELLTANGVVDANFNWTFGDGHLVIAGDVFDRGDQVTECLWLIYTLEEKAKAAGGYVHFVLGNHEIMNMSGSFRYVHPKYKSIAGILGKEYAELYNNKAELGRWLRTKNIMEKIGDILFVHAGISEEMMKLPLTLEQINTLARQYYDKPDQITQSPNRSLQVLYDSKQSPFWYRSYYQEEEMKVTLAGDTLWRTPMAVVDASLAIFEVKQIVTGHTIVADSISTHFGGKVINTDTRHAEGKSEALLIEGDRYYRVNDKGNKIRLFIMQSP